jgi:hypothetical protein
VTKRYRTAAGCFWHNAESSFFSIVFRHSFSLQDGTKTTDCAAGCGRIAVGNRIAKLHFFIFENAALN